MFLIECINDNSYCIIEDDDVYGDGEIGSIIHFNWNDSVTDLKKKLKELQTIDKENDTSQNKIKEKRERKEKRSYSPDEERCSSKKNKNKGKSMRDIVKATESANS